MRFPLFFALLAVICLFSCVADSNLEDAKRQGSEPPPIRQQDESGRVPYLPSDVSNEEGEAVGVGWTGQGWEVEREGVSTPIRCRVEEFDYTVDPKRVKKELVTWVKQEVDFKRTVSAEQRMRNADHLHLVSVTLEVDSGASLDFLEWVRIYVVPPGQEPVEVAWGALFGDVYEAELLVEGSHDLRAFVREDGDVKLLGTASAYSPSEDTMLGATLTFRSYHDCVED